MRKLIFVGLLFAGTLFAAMGLCQPAAAQVYFNGAPTGSCSQLGSVGFAINSITGDMYWCNSNAWVRYVPAGIISMQISGTCQPGWTEVMALNGQFLQGTVAANGDVGTTGGNATITPAGTVTAPVFTGTPGTVPAETFTGTSNQATSGTSAGTPQGTNAATATSGNCAATNIAAGTGSTTACKATAPNLTVPAETFTGTVLATHQHTLTPGGTNSTAPFTPAGTNAAPSFTGTAVDPRPQFTKVIFCSKN